MGGCVDSDVTALRGCLLVGGFFVVQKSLQQSMDEPEFQLTDFGKMQQPAQLHIAFQVSPNI